MTKITLDKITGVLAPTGWKCLSDKYTNLDTEMVFECNEGHKVYGSWKKLRVKQECPVCHLNENKKISNISARPKKKGVYRTLALDQSSNATGYSMYDNDILIAYGVFHAQGATPHSRMLDLCDWLDSMIESWKPDCVGLEETQYNPGMKGKDFSMMGHDVFKLLSQIMGGCILIILRHKVELKTVLIPTWRHHCGVKGVKRADLKRSAQHLVKTWYDITVTDDESDAICIGKYFSDNYKGSQVLIGEWD